MTSKRQYGMLLTGPGGNVLCYTSEKGGNREKRRQSWWIRKSTVRNRFLPFLRCVWCVMTSAFLAESRTKDDDKYVHVPKYWPGINLISKPSKVRKALFSFFYLIPSMTWFYIIETQVMRWTSKIISQNTSSTQNEEGNVLEEKMNHKWWGES
jgi:hypothetical protein